LVNAKQNRFAVIAIAALTLMVSSCSRVAWASGPVFFDDFKHPSEAWFYGNQSVGRDAQSREEGMALGGAVAEATLAGTAVHPENLRTFKASFRWSFIQRAGSADVNLSIGWGKAHEWGSIDECPLRLTIDSAGRVTLRAGNRVLGETRIAAAADGVYALDFAQQDARVVIETLEGETVFPLPAEVAPHSGYLMLRAEDARNRSGKDVVRIQQVRLELSGTRSPMTVSERNRDIQSWVKQRENSNWEFLTRVKEKVTSETAAGRWGYKIDLSVHPGLVRAGEKVEVEFLAQGNVPSPSSARLEPDFLSVTAGVAEEMTLNWNPNGHGGQTAKVEFTPRKPGNWRVVWQAGAESLSRTVAVVEPGYAVVRFLITSDKDMWIPNHDPGAYDTIHSYGLGVDSWSADEWVSPYSRLLDNLLVHFGVFARGRHKWGDHVMPLANLNWFAAGSPDTNLWRMNDDVQREGIEQAQQLWKILGLGPMDIFASYTYGHSTAGIAQSLGVKVLDSLCQWQDWRDGGSNNSWLINHVGAPAWPYYVAADDFRKTAAGRSIVAFTQNTNSSVRLWDIMTSEGEPQTNFRRAHGNERAESANTDRFETVVDLWLEEASHQQEPLFLSVGLENFVDSPDWNEANKRGVRYLLEQARTRKVVFASAADIADYFQQHYAVQPETWIVWPDIYAGQAGAYKPRQLPDRIELSNANFHSEHEDGDALPRYFWDFSKPWSEPVWDDQTAIRKQFGLVQPDLLAAENSVPRMVDLNGFHADAKQSVEDGRVEVSVTVDAPRVIATLPVAVWRVPLAPSGITATAQQGNARYVAVTDGSTGNSHGVVVLNNVPKGRSKWSVVVKGQTRTPLQPQVQIGAHVRGRMFLRNEAPQIYVWLTDAQAPSGVLKIRVPEARIASVHYNDGKVERSIGGELPVVLDRNWRHESPLITGLTAEELQSLSSFAADN
jgi:hypothetical protein